MAEFAIGKFQVMGTLGTGAHSTILHVRRSADGKQYALKVVPIEDKDDLKFLEQARHEFRVGSLLQHPNLIRVHTLETVRDWLFRIRKAHLLVEYVNGKTLDTIPRLSLPRLVQVFARIAAGLAHMHRRNVFHADLKPNNILLSKAGEVKIIDYGLAWIKGEPKERVQGTPEYMAPEQSRSQKVDERTDIYNFGATMYRLVTFRLPPSTLAAGEGMPMNESAFKSLLKPVQEFNPLTPQPLADLIHRCLAYKASQRPERMTEVKELLERLETKMVRTAEDALENLEW